MKIACISQTVMDSGTSGSKGWITLSIESITIIGSGHSYPVDSYLMDLMDSSIPHSLFRSSVQYNTLLRIPPWRYSRNNERSG